MVTLDVVSLASPTQDYTGYMHNPVNGGGGGYTAVVAVLVGGRGGPRFMSGFQAVLTTIEWASCNIEKCKNYRDRMIDRQKDRQIDRQTDTHSHTNTFTDTHT